MFLYHYANNKFNTLLTKEKQNLVIPEERKKEEKAYMAHYKLFKYKKPGYYFEHISFFFEPICLDIIAEIFPSDHSVWFSGNELYQYTVDTAKIGHFSYEIVEFPEKSTIYYDNTINDKEYHKLYKDIVIKNNYVGKNFEIEKASKHLIGLTRTYFEQFKNRPNYEEHKYKYAATVPHVMLYPYLGKIKPESVTKVQVK